MEWKSYSKKAGWTLRLLREERAIAYLSPCRDSFFVSFILGGRAVEAVRRSGLPRAVVKSIDRARRYVEGTGIRIEVKKVRDVETVKELAAIKIEN